MKGIDILIPLHKYDTEVSELLKRCLTSISDSMGTNKDITHYITIIGTPKVCGMENEIRELLKGINNDEEYWSFKLVENKDGEYDFCSQVNYAVKNYCETDYFMVVEYDDMITPKWVGVALPYIKERKKCPMFLPLVEVYDIKNVNNPLYYINEIGWSSSFVENELGVLTNDNLKDYCNFNITGSIMKKFDFIKAGGLKPSIKLSFGYELMLRLSNLYKELFVVPKVGYFHFINREGSLTSEYYQTMSQKEGSWWINLALEEYTYKHDREIAYSEIEE